MSTNYRIPKPAITFQPPTYICRKTNKPFTLDGNIHKDFWLDVPFTEDFIDIQGEHMPTPRFRTRAKMQWDNQNFYFAALLEGDEIWATVTKRDDVIFRDNDFEIFIDPDSDTQQYFEFEMNAMNTVWDLLLTKAYRDNGCAVNGWDIHGLQSAVHIEGVLDQPSANNKYWSVEVVIPFESIIECAAQKRLPMDGEYYRVNFSRVHWLVDVVDNQYKKRINPQTNKNYPEDNWVWAPTGLINIHYPELWGFVFFSDDATKSNDGYTIPEDEKIKWELRKLYYAQHAYYDENGLFTNDLKILTKEDTPSFDVNIETTSHTFELSCKNSSGTGTISIFSDGKTISYSN